MNESFGPLIIASDFESSIDLSKFPFVSVAYSLFFVIIIVNPLGSRYSMSLYFISISLLLYILFFMLFFLFINDFTIKSLILSSLDTLSRNTYPIFLLFIFTYF